jgi:transcriptional regulator GlxA family with amidase domain
MGKEAVIEHLLGLLMINLLRAYGAAGGLDWMAALRDGAVARAIGRMHVAPERGCTVAALAAETAMSRSSFAARFKRQVDSGPLEYLSRWRMQLAAESLQDTELRIDQVAEKVGYASEAEFSRAFKRSFTRSPGAWRRRVRGLDRGEPDHGRRDGSGRGSPGTHRSHQHSM